MPNDRPDPGEFFEMAQRMLRELLGDARRDEPGGGEDPWADVTRRFRESFAGGRPSRSDQRFHEPSPEEQRENLTFALATRAVEALEDLALNVAAIRQRLERTEPPSSTGSGGPPDSEDATGGLTSVSRGCAARRRSSCRRRARSSPPCRRAG